METVKTIKVQLVQQGNESKNLTFTGQIEANKNTEIGGTIAGRILKLHRNARIFKQKLNFSFARKFDVKLSINGKEISGSDLLNGVIDFGLTVQNNEKSIEKFCAFIESLVTDVLTGENHAIYEMDEVLSEAKKYLNA
jgi:hypothetical protein